MMVMSQCENKTPGPLTKRTVLKSQMRLYSFTIVGLSDYCFCLIC